jgi:hypothetical protein
MSKTEQGTLEHQMRQNMSCEIMGDINLLNTTMKFCARAWPECTRFSFKLELFLLLFAGWG